MSARRFAWHFLKLTEGKPTLRDGTALQMNAWLEFSGTLRICHDGLHASWNARDAVRYAPGVYVTYCEIGGNVVEQEDKLVCSRRKPLFGFDASEVLRLFARHAALSVAHLWKRPMPDVVRQYLETGDESIREEARKAAAYAAAADAAAAAAAAAYAAAADAYAAADAAADADADAYAYAYAYAYYAARRKKNEELNEDLELMLFAYAEHIGVLPKEL